MLIHFPLVIQSEYMAVHLAVTKPAKEFEVVARYVKHWIFSQKIIPDDYVDIKLTMQIGITKTNAY